MEPIQLNPIQVVETIERLERRIGDRFPKSGLRKVCNQFLEVARKSEDNIKWLSKPNYAMRVLGGGVLVLGLVALLYSFRFVDMSLENTRIDYVLMFVESIFNDVVLLGAAIFFIVTIETRIKRRRASSMLNDLRVIAHVVDMHQLTKDPSSIVLEKRATKNSPNRNLTVFELERYLEYCSELAALVSKVSALYAQSLPEQQVVTAVNEIEVLCTALSQKIWQKLVILNETKNHKSK